MSSRSSTCRPGASSIRAAPRPGINFIPVGALPTDVATTPDGKMAFVGSAETEQGRDLRYPDASPPRRHGRALPARHRADVALLVAGLRASAESGRARDRAASRGHAGCWRRRGCRRRRTAATPARRRLRSRVRARRRPSGRSAQLGEGHHHRPATVSSWWPERNADGTLDYSSDPTLSREGPVLQPGSLAACPITSAIELERRERCSDLVRPRSRLGRRREVRRRRHRPHLPPARAGRRTVVRRRAARPRSSRPTRVTQGPKAASTQALQTREPASLWVGNRRTPRRDPARPRTARPAAPRRDRSRRPDALRRRRRRPAHPRHRPVDPRRAARASSARS